MTLDETCMGPLTRLLGRVVRFGDNSGTAATLLISPQPQIPHLQDPYVDQRLCLQRGPSSK